MIDPASAYIAHAGQCRHCRSWANDPKDCPQGERLYALVGSGSMAANRRIRPESPDFGEIAKKRRP